MKSYRGLALAVAALFCVSRGLAYLPLTAGPDKLPTGLAVLGAFIPLPIWAVVWLGIAATCVIQIWTRTDKLAWALFTGIMAAWGATYLFGWIVILHSDHTSREWLTGLTYLCPAIIIMLRTPKSVAK